MNTMAEGRVLVPWEHQKYPNLTVQYTGGSFFTEVSFLSKAVTLDSSDWGSSTEHLIYPGLARDRGRMGGIPTHLSSDNPCTPPFQLVESTLRQPGP